MERVIIIRAAIWVVCLLITVESVSCRSIMSNQSSPENPLQIHTHTLGPWQTNCYVVHRSRGSDCWIIDAGFEPEPMIAAIREQGLRPVRLILTHAHLDHIAGVNEVRAAWPDLPIDLHEAERDFPTDPELNLAAWAGLAITAPPADRLLAGGEHLELDGMTFEVRHTPGHSPGGITLYNPEQAAAIVGDTLFAGGIGRYDFPTSDGPTLMRSIGEQLLTLPDETAVHPGHGPATTLGRERQSNPFLTQV